MRSITGPRSSRSSFKVKQTMLCMANWHQFKFAIGINDSTLHLDSCTRSGRSLGGFSATPLKPHIYFSTTRGGYVGRERGGGPGQPARAELRTKTLQTRGALYFLFRSFTITKGLWRGVGEPPLRGLYNGPAFINRPSSVS